MKLPILRSNPEDQILYQTERYNEETFGYEVPIKEEGDYVLVLKFAEVYFAQSQQKVRHAQAPLDQWHIAAFEQLGTVEPEQRPVNLLRREGQ